MADNLKLLHQLKQKTNLRKHVKSNAFTLSEVLITLAIIGIVAVLSMSTLIQKYNEKIAVVKLKKVYAELNQAYRLAIIENGTPTSWTISTSTEEFRDTLLKYMNINKKCAPQEKGCIYDTAIKLIDGTPEATNLIERPDYTSALLTNGALLLFSELHNDCGMWGKACGQIVVDINGYAKPNQYGKDVFSFLATKDYIIPRGASSETYNVLQFSEYCQQIGHACAGWVIENENLDYLHCDDLSWDGKRSCKD